MIQSILFFILGFLCAGFIAMLIAPVALRRAARLTRRRIEASMPLTPAEIQADKDHIRAEAAMSIRRLEMSVSSLREKALTQLVEISRGLEDIKALNAAGDEKAKMIAALEAQIGTVQADFARQQEEMQRLSASLAEAEKAENTNAEALAQLGAMYDEASFTASTRQIELVAREGEIERLTGTVQQLRAQRKDAEARARAQALETRTARDEMKTERKRANDLDKKVTQLTARLADREDRLKRPEKGRGPRFEDTAVGAAASVAGAAEAGIEQSLAELSADRERLEERLAALARENKRLKAKEQAAGFSGGGDGAENDGALLREQMNELAAQVISLTAALEGPDSPIIKALETAGPREIDGAARPVSLADRVRALRKAASPD
ncbi:hypothetical protein [Mesorhizobium sp. KR1-2]|uniref:hypothetical protein n=1 Tax=Mesorhizobium sp. KR1-2 TaxID=3156609 RepID=UPI0032B44BC5